MTQHSAFEFCPEYMPEKQHGPDTSTVLFQILGDMIDDFTEKEYTATVKFIGKKLNRGVSIGKLKIVKSVDHAKG